MRVAVQGSFSDTTWVNVFWLKVITSGTPTGTQVAGLAHSFLADYNTSLMPGRSTACQTAQCICQWNDGSGGMVEGADATPAPGDQAGSFLSAQVALIISWRLAVRYRGGHPRSYLAGWPTTALLAANNWQSGVVTATQTRVSTFLTNINGLTPTGFSSVTLGVLRQFANKGSEAKPPNFLDPPQFRPFTSAVVKPGLATQRRRLGANLN